MRLFVLGNREGRRLVPLQIVAAVAGVQIWSRSKLAVVPVGMAIGTMLELHFEQRVLPFRDMTLRALQPGVASLQRIRAQGVLLDREKGGLPSLHRMARRTLTGVGTFSKLAIVRIGFVTIHAFRENQRLLEVSIGMALRAIDRGVFAFERIFGLRVVEPLVDRLQRDLLPAARAMAGLATLREAAVVRVLVTIGALVEGDTDVLRLPIRPVDMALGTLHLGVQSG